MTKYEFLNLIDSELKTLGLIINVDCKGYYLTDEKGMVQPLTKDDILDHIYYIRKLLTELHKSDKSWENCDD